jgi:UDP-N-acetylmuramoyl-tripeptide--D-alanyl-D-alanine ligase
VNGNQGIGLRASEIACMVGGHVAGPDTTIDDVVIDSREATRGSLFVALAGTRTDGHGFVRDAFVRGATAALVSGMRLDAAMRGTQILVRDVGPALLALAASWRATLDAGVVAITGSVGKTTTKDLVAAVLEEAFRVVASHASYNNEIGVPLTVLAARPTTERLVCEIGAGAPGEIERLAEIVRPRVGIVTVVGPAHLGTFGSLERIARTKSELVRALPARGVAILNADDPVVASFAARTDATVVTFGRARRADLRAIDVEVDPDGHPSFIATTGVERCAVRVRLTGEHMVTPVLAALACGLADGIPLEEAARAVERVAARSGRMQRRTTPAGVDVIDDSYNANPVSMRAAVRALGSIAARSSVAVLGEMAELGGSGRAHHERIGREVAAARIDRLVTVGPRATAIADGARAAGMPTDRVTSCDDATDATVAVKALAQAGDVVLVKGSRAAHLEAVVESFEREPNDDHGARDILGRSHDGRGDEAVRRTHRGQGAGRAGVRLRLGHDDA